LLDQSEKIEEMIRIYHTMIAKISVLKTSSKLFKMAGEAEDSDSELFRNQAK